VKQTYEIRTVGKRTEQIVVFGNLKKRNLFSYEVVLLS
jgi:hypothetical protein